MPIITPDERFNRNIKIFKDILEGFSLSLIGQRRVVSPRTVSLALNTILDKLREFITNENLPQPKGWTRDDLVAEKNYWLDVVNKYLVSLTVRKQ